jgi:hypothetical protein
MQDTPYYYFLRAGRGLLFSLVLGLLFAGCATTNRTALVPAGLERIKSVNVTATIPQPEIAADVVPSNVTALTGGGLIAALIDVAVEAKRSKAAENAITPLRDALVDFNAAEALRTSLAEEMIPEAPVPVKAVNVAMEMKGDAIRQHVEAGAADALLLISVDYRLSPNFDRIRVLARVSLLQKGRGAAGDKPLYQNEFATYRRLAVPALGKDNAAVVLQWSENKGAPARQAVLACFAELADMIEFDLQQGPEANMPAKDTLTTHAPATGRMAMMQGVDLRGAVARRSDARTWVRLPTGELSSTE